MRYARHVFYLVALNTTGPCLYRVVKIKGWITLGRLSLEMYPFPDAMTMQRTRFIMAGLVALLLSGCIPLKQYNVTNERGEWYQGFGYCEGYGLLQMGQSNQPKKGPIVDAESFAIGPRGKQYGVESELHPYDLREDRDPRLKYVRDRIYLVDAKNKRLSTWRNGDWQFTFVQDTPDGKVTQTVNMTLWTFFYNPVIHGPPN